MFLWQAVALCSALVLEWRSKRIEFAVPDYSNYQKKLIDRYYDHRDVIMLNKLQELVTELFLVESDKKRETLWNRAEKAMRNLKTTEKQISHILEKRDPQVLAGCVRDWLKEASSRG